MKHVQSSLDLFAAADEAEPEAAVRPLRAAESAEAGDPCVIAPDRLAERVAVVDAPAYVWDWLARYVEGH